MGAGAFGWATSPSGVVYRRIQHAAHYAGAPFADGRIGHDLEEWTYAQADRLPRPEGIPTDAEWHIGFRIGSTQCWTYIRRAELTAAPCDRCREMRARAPGGAK